MSPIRPERKVLYPADWPEISLRIRTERAKGRCECAGECGTGHTGRCSALNAEPHPVTGSTVVLTVAHLDRHPPNVDPDNLRAMCQRCHLSYDRDQHAANASRTRAELRAEGMAPLFEAAPVLPPCTPDARCGSCVRAKAATADGMLAAAHGYRLKAVPYHATHGYVQDTAVSS